MKNPKPIMMVEDSGMQKTNPQKRNTIHMKIRKTGHPEPVNTGKVG